MPLGQNQVPFPDSSFPGTPTHSQESSGRMINCYIEPLGPAAPGPNIYRRAPGVRSWGTTVRSGFRGAFEAGGLVYAAFNNRLVYWSSAAGGAATDIAALTGTAKGFFARNQASPNPDLVFCDPDGNYAKFTTGAVTMNYDVDLPAPNSVCNVDGFFFFTIGDGRVFASDFNATNVDALANATAEAKADGLIRGISWAGALWLFGPSTTEVWSNAGTTPFPFSRAVVIPRGIAGPYCVSGFEDNFSRTLIWVADDNTVVQCDGYNPNKISPPDLDGLIEKVTDKRELEMSCFISRGHAFVLLSSATWSWVFDLNTQRWSERMSYLQQRSRIIGGTYAFGSKWLCGDVLTGNVHEITNTVHTEPVRVQTVTGAVAGTGGRIKLTVTNSMLLSDRVIVTGVLGTTEANGIWTMSLIDPTHIELVGSTFAHAYVSGGTVSDAFEMPFRWRLESGAVENFPVGARVGRADFEFVTGVGITQSGYQENITSVIDGGGGVAHQIWVKIPNTARITNGDAVSITGVGGTTEANGTWSVTVIDYQTIQLNGSLFAHAYTTGGIATLLSPLEPIETDPVVEISWSDDGGQTYYAPIQRKLGKQAKTKELVSLIACTGRSSWNARRWRLDISDPVYVGFMAAYQNQSPKVSDIG